MVYTLNNDSSLFAVLQKECIQAATNIKVYADITKRVYPSWYKYQVYADTYSL